jgi:hypothetical protein
MVLGIALLTASVIGMIYGIVRKSKRLIVVSVIVSVIIIAVWMYFYSNPY